MYIFELERCLVMDEIFKAKVVGLSFHKVQNAVENGDSVLLVSDTENEYDTDAIKVINSEGDVVGFVANSDRTLSTNNRANGNLSASELREKLNFDNREYVAEVIKSFRSCIYLEINSENWSNLHHPSHEISEIDALKAEIESLKGLMSDLQDQVASLKTFVTVGDGDSSLPTTSDGRVLYSVVGLSHFDGQDHLGYELSIQEEPIFEGAKGTALYLKSGDYRVGVFPSAKKKAYCEEHGIPYCESKQLKGKSFDGNVIIEEIVYNEYAVVSI